MENKLDDKIVETLLEEVADLHEVPQGAYNIRLNKREVAQLLRKSLFCAPM